MFTDRKIAAFTRTIADMPDTPQLSAADLKARFDENPEQLRQTVNAVCDDGAALESRIDAYRAQTFTGEITEAMLAAPLAAKLEGKTDQTDSAAAHAALTAAIAEKCKLVCGEYTGDGTETRTIDLGFEPRAVFVYPADSRLIDYTGSKYYSGLALTNCPVTYTIYDTTTQLTVLATHETGFTVGFVDRYSIYLNNTDKKYRYLAFA